MASLSGLLSPSLSPSPANLKPRSSSQCTFPSSVSQQLKITTKSLFRSVNDDVINTSFANANLMFYKSSFYNVEFVPKEGESEEQLVNDFKRSVFRAGVLQEARRRRFFENSQEKRKRKHKEAAKKYRKRRPIPKPKANSTPEISKKRQVEEEDDNWELPPEDFEIPYTNRF
ncbi:hypothetical protein AALP_AA8G464400 [Arabis alpina]|uniref:30S ribosomal protein S21, chloroplastic n=1 Tax=Arabis alpina TaxID=50452 RepID=A0A087GDU3_ARAAL|nr:hypothetical protein AALP_AA8G464400 [Arabis alpina]